MIPILLLNSLGDWLQNLWELLFDKFLQICSCGDANYSSEQWQHCMLTQNIFFSQIVLIWGMDHLYQFCELAGHYIQYWEKRFVQTLTYSLYVIRAQDHHDPPVSFCSSAELSLSWAYLAVLSAHGYICPFSLANEQIKFMNYIFNIILNTASNWFSSNWSRFLLSLLVMLIAFLH